MQLEDRDSVLEGGSRTVAILPCINRFLANGHLYMNNDYTLYPSINTSLFIFCSIIIYTLSVCVDNKRSLLLAVCQC